MRIASVADLHLRGKDLPAGRSQLAGLVHECLERGVHLLAVAGDVFDRATIGDNYASTGAIAEVAIGAFGELTKRGVDVVMIPGNHDQSGAGSADALHVFDGMDRIRIFRQPAMHSNGGVTIYAVPWSWGGQDAERTIAELVAASPAEGPKLLLGHLQVTGGRLSGGFTCEAKLGSWQVSRAFLERTKVDHIALGDFHARQHLADAGGYVGAMRQLNFGEEGNPAGFEIWDTESGETQWIDLNAAPRYCTKIFAPGKHLALAVTGNLIQRVRIEGKADPLEVRQMESAGIQIEQIIECEERVRRAKVPEGIIQNPHKLIELWAGAQEPPVDGARCLQMVEAFERLFADKAQKEQAPALEMERACF